MLQASGELLILPSLSFLFVSFSSLSLSYCLPYYWTFCMFEETNKSFSAFFAIIVPSFTHFDQICSESLCIKTHNQSFSDWSMLVYDPCYDNFKNLISNFKKNYRTIWTIQITPIRILDFIFKFIIHHHHLKLSKSVYDQMY